jgi:hypothetical protein
VVYSKVESCMHRDEVAHPAVREVRRFRDAAFLRYFGRPEYLDRLRERFGDGAVAEVRAMVAARTAREG